MLSTTRFRGANRLTALKVQKSKSPGILDDGNGLRLFINKHGHKRWTCRVMVAGRRVSRGLGSYPDITLEAARTKAEDLRRAAREGRDFAKQIKVERAKGSLSFRQAFERYFEDIKRPSLKPNRHAARWPISMENHVYPKLGERPVAEIDASEIIALLQPIWHTKRETANRVLQRISIIFKSTIVRGDRLTANPCEGVREELGKARPRVVHRRALPWSDVPAFARSLEQRTRLSDASRLALLFVIHTACRSEEVRGARWSEIDRTANEWTVPEARMKMKREHIVPLSDGAVAVLKRAKKIRRLDTDLIFPSNRGTVLSDNTLSKLMRDAEVNGTPHGFRTSFKVWASENGIRDEVSEAVLAHGDPDRVRAAYRRTTFLDDRRIAMKRWSELVASQMAAASLQAGRHTPPAI